MKIKQEKRRCLYLFQASVFVRSETGALTTTKIIKKSGKLSMVSEKDKNALRKIIFIMNNQAE